MADIPSVRTPFYKIEIDGKEPSDDIYRKITRVVFKEPENGEQYFEITMADHDFSIQDGGMFIADKTVCSLYMGYLDDYELMMDGLVQVIAPDYPASDSPSLTITVKNISSIMNREQKQKAYPNKTYSAIVKEIADSYGLDGDIDDTMEKIYDPKPVKDAPVSPQPAEAGLKVGGKAKLNGYLYATSYGERRGQHRNQEVTISRIVDTSRKCPYLVNGTLGWVARADLTPITNEGKKTPVTKDDKEPVVMNTVYQTGESDYEFCKRLADEIGFRFYIDCNTLYFKKFIQKNTIDLDYRVGEQNLISFRRNINTTNTGNTYKAANIDFNEKTVSNAGEPAPPAPVVEAKPPAPRTYTVKKGDYLIKIAKQFYGDGSQYKKIYEANKSKVKMPKYVIYTGTVLTIP